MIASSELVALCQSQVTVLSEGLGAVLSVVYLTEGLTTSPDREPNLRLTAVYPESWGNQGKGHLPLLVHSGNPVPTSPESVLTREQSLAASQGGLRVVGGTVDGPGTFKQPHNAVVPLVYEDVVLGLLVTGREDRPWTGPEQAQIDHIARTLAIACWLDQRAQWFKQGYYRTQDLRQQRQERLEDLFHQFRNPLTAVQTFGKLLRKRLLPGDANQDIATGIVRESDRLKQILQEIQRTASLDGLELAQLPPSLHPGQQPEPLPPLLPSPPSQWDPVKSLPAGAALRGFHTMPSLPGSDSFSPLLPLTSCNPEAILIPLMSTARAIAQERGLQITLEVSPNLPRVQTNALALGEILNNLLDNALKYTPEGGRIGVRVDCQTRTDETRSALPQQAAASRGSNSQEWVGIGIADTGSLIPPADVPHIFDRRYRGIQATTPIPGSGLGLAIAQELITSMGGSIELLQTTDVQDTERGSPFLPLTANKVFIVWLRQVV